MPRLFLERDSARTSPDKHAQAVLDHLVAAPDADLAAAMVDCFNADGPAWALPPGYLATRYEHGQHRTVLFGVFGDKPVTDAELERLLAVERVDRASGKIVRSNHYAVAKRA